MSTNTPGNGGSTPPAPAPASAPTTSTPSSPPPPQDTTTDVRLSADRWSRMSSARLGVAPEIIRAALKGQSGDMSQADVESAVKDFLSQPAGRAE